MAKDYSARAKQEFERVADTVRESDLKVIFADHSAKGRLQSGSTIIVSVRAFEDRSRAALQNLQRQFSNQIDSRGREWRRAMTALHTALSEHLDAAPDILSDAIKVALGKVGSGPTPTEGSVVNAFRDLINKTREILIEEQHLYAEKWTAPSGKSWIERNKFKYGFAAAIGGAALSKVADIIYSWIM